MTEQRSSRVNLPREIRVSPLDQKMREARRRGVQHTGMNQVDVFGSRHVVGHCR